MTVIQHLVDGLMEDRKSDSNKTITKEQYRQWAAGFVFEGLRGQRYGQSFCNQFGIKDNILYYSSTVEEADRYIQRNYVR